MRVLVLSVMVLGTFASVARAQESDSATVASLLPFALEMIGDDVTGIWSDTAAGSRALAAAVALRLGLAAPAAGAEPDSLPACPGSREPGGSRGGRVASISWSATSAQEVSLAVGSMCALDRKPFANGAIQRFRRDRDGKWRKDGPPVTWIS